MIKSTTLQQVRENYTGYSDNQGVSYYEWLKNEEENDPSFFSGMFDDGNIEGIEDLSEEQRAEYDSFMADQKQEAEFSAIISNIEGCYIDVFSYQWINEDAVFVRFNFDGGTYGDTCAVIYKDGTVFTPRDWQSWECPEEAGYIKDFEWMELKSKRDAVVMDNLPRIL